MEFRVGDECFCKMSISVDEVARESSSSRGVAAGLLFADYSPFLKKDEPIKQKVLAQLHF